MTMMDMEIAENRADLNKTINFVKKLILNGYTEESGDENFAWIQECMNKIRPYVNPFQYTRLGEMVRLAYTDSVDVKELNQLVREMKVDETLVF